ncbi:MAG: SUMF1/EgtB/PvdO family nonheme iron enzyme [Nitrospinae bacterium]|nr:SUMF1/EgtB/PvdO family nonheme iron enzyme [Nitrospinota bacterium]
MAYWAYLLILPILAFSSPRSQALEPEEGILGKMVYIPEGEFIMGSDHDDKDLKTYHDIWGYEVRPRKEGKEEVKIGPAKKVSLKGFYIDAHEVANAQYKKFVDATGYRLPTQWEDSGTYPEGEDNYPVYNVSWNDANAYARWAGKRLPTEEEWEKAARGKDDRLYPWGNEKIKEAVKTWDSMRGYAQETGKNKYDRSPYGVYDMAGNLMEWTATKIENSIRWGHSLEETGYETGVIIKGGGWGVELDEAKIPRKVLASPDSVINGIGFRCAK